MENALFDDFAMVKRTYFDHLNLGYKGNQDSNRSMAFVDSTSSVVCRVAMDPGWMFLLAKQNI